MVSSRSKKLLVSTLGSLLISGNVMAAVKLNSSCDMKVTSTNRKVNGTNIDVKYPLASIAKVVTTLWAVDTLGADYRFKTVLHVSPSADQGNSYDIHIQGSRDPMFGRNMGYFLVSELNRMGIKRIDKLTFDENFLLTWLAEEKPLIAGNTPKYGSLENQARIMRQAIISNLGTEVSKPNYESLRSKASSIGVSLEKNISLSINNVSFVKKSAYSKPSDARTVELKSAPLRTLLKRMNNQSNNYIADTLFNNLGGRSAFADYAKKALDAGPESIVFYNGSGNNEGNIANPIYNQATCETMIKALYRLDKKLEENSYRISDVMAVAGRDNDSTVARYGGNMAGATVAKTGSVNKAKTLAGVISTNQGEVLFTILMHTDYDRNRSDWGVANNQIRNRLSSLINKYGGADRITYSERTLLSFDKSSYLVEVGTGQKLAKN